MIGVTLNSRVKIINRDKYISLHGEDSEASQMCSVNLSLLNTVLRMAKSFFVRMIRVKNIFFFSDCIAYVDHVKERSILDEAKDIRNNSRQSDYGDAVVNFENISKMASLITGKELSPYDCVAVQISVKLCRQGFHKKRDNMVDLAGYADIMQLIVDRENLENGEKG